MKKYPMQGMSMGEYWLAILHSKEWQDKKDRIILEHVMQIEESKK